MILSATRLQKALLLGLLSVALFGGCASTNNPRDPLEPFNRAVYQFNDGLDKAVMKPVATVYREILPDFVQTGVTNFFNNLYDIITALNNLLQGKISDAASDIGRLAINTTIGVAGLLDVATEIGLEKHKEDFGQTLGRWGIGSGPYLQLPFFGPSSVRDAIGLFGDFRADPIRWIWRDHTVTRSAMWGLFYVNLRANLLESTRILDEAALDPYEFQRDAYLQRRRNLVYDGNPPPLPEEEDLPQPKVKPGTQPVQPGKLFGASLGVPQEQSAVEASPAETQPQTPPVEPPIVETPAPLPADSASTPAVPVAAHVL